MQEKIKKIQYFFYKWKKTLFRCEVYIYIYIYIYSIYIYIYCILQSLNKRVTSVQSHRNKESVNIIAEILEMSSCRK